MRALPRVSGISLFPVNSSENREASPDSLLVFCQWRWLEPLLLGYLLYPTLTPSLPRGRALPRSLARSIPHPFHSIRAHAHVYSSIYILTPPFAPPSLDSGCAILFPRLAAKTLFLFLRSRGGLLAAADVRPPVQEDRQTRESPVSRFFSRLSLSASSLAGRERERESALRLYIVLKDVDSAFPPSLSTHPTHPIHPTRIHTYIPILNPKQPPSDNFYSYDPQRRRRGGGGGSPSQRRREARLLQFWHFSQGRAVIYLEIRYFAILNF